jgi:hypothetical protein
MKLIVCTLHIKTATVIVQGHNCTCQLSIGCHYASANLSDWCWPLSAVQQQEVTKCTATQNNALFYSKFKISVIKQQNLITDIMMSNSLRYMGYAHYETLSHPITHRHAHLWWPLSSVMWHCVVWYKHTEVGVKGSCSLHEDGQMPLKCQHSTMQHHSALRYILTT